jgi:PmbA protein
MLSPHEIYFNRNAELSMMFTGGKTKTRELTETSGYGIRVIKDKKIGFSYCVKEDEIEGAIKNAEIFSRFSKETDFSFAENMEYSPVKVYDGGVAGLEVGDLKEIMDQLRDGASKYSENVKVIVSASNGETRIENSSGFSGDYKNTAVSVYVEVMDGTGFGYYYNAFTYLPKDFTRMGIKAAETAKKTRRPEKPEAGEYIIVMEPEPLDDLMDVLLPSFMGEWKRRKISVLSEKEGQKIFSNRLSIYEDGTLEGTGGRPFDDEGTVSGRVPLVEKGVLKNFAYDRENAALEGLKKGGQCNRTDFSAEPGTGFSNIAIEGGDYRNLEELGKVIVVKSLHGTHTANRTTGDFGVEVNSGFFVYQGERVPVRGFMLTGNIFNLFKNIIGIEKRVRSLGSFFCPRIAFEKLRVVS